ncbi:translocation/assembly module TamB domain-containing protein [Paraburkholderia rhizosphaerae]|uniref:Autotransporter secretion inner membrane protein TamB n=1 Tax=Paraburkholderia rhizosphaerae TaxID=480658 RepID=A0A4R8LJW0_9BURK|nr:translocation/assembly module TamB domain-containing protein [Paraburkholderia rhizosphaerae]TDY44392.1 autotransporter secretion inner membrane protein TamB [Paraburkholderia rhizosphaerae]
MSTDRLASLSSSERPGDLPSGAADRAGAGGADGGGRGPGGADIPPPPKRRRGRLWRALVWATFIPVLIVALLAGALYGVVATERGTGYAWQAAVKLLGGRLAGTFEGGTLATGVRLAHVQWRSLDGSGTEIRVDRASGKWALSGRPWKFVVSYLHVGTIDARLAPSTEPSSPLVLPQDLQLPMQLDVRDLQVDKLVLHQAGSTSEYGRLLFHGRSDGRHHEASVDRLDTPFGVVTAQAKLDGVRPFPLTGEAGYSGKVHDEAVQVRGHVSGTLETLVAELDASGMKLDGHALVEATPFADVPLQRAMLTFDHVNPQAFAPGAPAADLSVRADLRPAQERAAEAAQGASAAAAGAMPASGGAGTGKSDSADAAKARGAAKPESTATANGSRAAGASKAADVSKPSSETGAQQPAAASTATGAISLADHGNAASAPTAASAPGAPVNPATRPRGFAVAGSVSIVNAIPGAIDQHLLPLIDAYADVRLDAQAQHISNLNVRVVRNATVTGDGELAGKRGRFDLRVARLDLNALQASIRPTQFAGPIAIRLNDDIRTVTLDLADPQAALRVQGKVTLDPARTSFNDVRLTSGRGRIDLSGAVKNDASSTYNLKATLTDFDPLTLTSMMTPAPAPATPARASASGGRRPAAAPARASATAARRSPAAPAQPARKIEARVNGTLSASGLLAPTFTTKAEFRLGDSVYDNLPMTGSGTIQLAGSRLLPSRANLSVAGNQVDLQGSFGGRGDRLRFRIDAPQLDRLGFGVAGNVSAEGDLTGTFAHPNVTLDYKADDVVFGSNRVGHAAGHAELRDGANGAMVFTTDARNLSTAGVELKTLTARLNGTRANHTLEAAAAGSLRDRPLDLTLAANGHLTDARDGTHWDGRVTRLQNRGTPALNMESPLTVSAGPQRLTLGATRITLEGALLDLKSLSYDHGRVRSAGTLTGVSVTRLQQLRQEFTGAAPVTRTDLVFDGDWDFALGDTSSGHIQLKRRSGDVTVSVGRGFASLGVTDIAARVDFAAGNRVNATVRAQASRVGSINADAHTALAVRDGMLTLDEDAPLTGTIAADLPSLRTTGGLLGPSYVLDGHMALRLALTGTVAKPKLSGSLQGDGLSVTAVDLGVQLKDGVVRIALSENLVDFQQVEFHGGSGTLRASGRVRLDNAEPDLTANIVADRLELFASPDRQLTLSGSASVANAGQPAGLEINGRFKVEHALFDMPAQSAPTLGDDVVIVQPDGTLLGGRPPPGAEGANRPVNPFVPRANIEIDLGNDFRFRGQGADVGLRGTITALSTPNTPLRAVGNVRVTEGSSYTAFGRKLAIENGFFTFNGPVSNPGINILAMRRNQEVEAGVQVTGTIQAPVARLVSEPAVPDNEKLSWLLFGHGTDQGNNLGQQSTMTAALALLGSASGKRIAQTFGFDEFSIGRSEVGLTDPQVVMVSKAINERLVIGYEQGLQSASNAVKATLNLTRFWSVTAYGGTFQGMDLQYTRRFDRWPWFSSSSSRESR